MFGAGEVRFSVLIEAGWSPLLATQALYWASNTLPMVSMTRGQWFRLMLEALSLLLVKLQRALKQTVTSEAELTYQVLNQLH